MLYNSRGKEVDKIVPFLAPKQQSITTLAKRKNLKNRVDKTLIIMIIFADTFSTR